MSLTDMRFINGRVESLISSPINIDEEIFFGENKMKQAGFYIIKDSFFKTMHEPYLKGNKSENRPHYYCFEDSTKGIYWVIPMSSRINKYKQIIRQKLAQGKPCDILHIAKLDNNKDSVFLIQDMFPITDKYIEREYTVNGIPLRITSEDLENEIDQKARKILSLLKSRIKFMPTQPDVLKIYNKLLRELKTSIRN